MSAARVTVRTPGGTYPVHVGRGLLGRLGDLLGDLAGAEAAAVVYPAVLAGPAGTAADALTARGLAVRQVEVPDGEAAKRLDVVAGLYERFAAVPLRRADLVVAVGGGATTDTAGFAAATWMRGVPVVHVPTTVLGMVDAAVGGKTGVDLPAGKNLVGAFHQPAAVVADLDVLATLPVRELRAGMAEVVKAGLIADPDLAARAAAAAPRILAADPDVLAPLVEAAVRIKADVVGADERESGLRAILNYGHTLGHALERIDGYLNLRHGEAVGVGMVFAALVAERAGMAAPGLAAGHADLLAALGLPTSLPVAGLDPDPDELLDAMATDKKHQGGPRLVLLHAPGRPEVVPAPARDVLLAALSDLRTR